MKLSQLSLLIGGVCLCEAASLMRAARSSHSNSRRDNSTAPADPMLQLSPDPDFHYEILRIMSTAPYEGADIGEVLIAASQIKPKDLESYYTAFNNLATRVDKAAKAIDSRKYPISARNALFKAASYYRSADFFLHGNWSDPWIYSLWDKQLAAFNAAMKLLPVPGHRITLRAKDDNFTIPAIFFGSGLPGPRPTIILCNGYDGSQEEMYHMVGQAALQRGMNVITYEGPGQPTVRREQNLGFIPQWEKVTTPVIDYALSRPEVDSGAIGLLGYSFGGFLAPRVAAFDDRIAAVFAVDGVYSFGQSLLDNFHSTQFTQIFESGNATLFNYIIEQVLADPKTETSVRWAVQQGMWSFNVKTPFEWVTRAQAYNLTDLTQKIKVPVFVGDAQNDEFFPGQAKMLADKLGSRATYHPFNAIDGAGEHCSVGAAVMETQVLLDWFQDVLHEGKGCH
ncbi:2,6-dihydropseudooxynicotine hydrolase [Tolypocladium ophioglossoides CBS 100239]|uniref:2,6-dihydropseudooxynicotine hydrolase n=1 Tax=Tolypocladium ophioglossoides (strain CBS 100239) TaxID=1163406 RepID=A0A0L0MZC9_TOLOC|nr:2,6-dihydropseudooxynicotine hydrolase [Tolypocladium ophioglossoides CBS 100239]